MQQLTQTVALMGLPKADRDVWFNAAAIELYELPANMVIEGLSRARKTCTRPAEVIPFIFREYAGYAEKIRARINLITSTAAKLEIAL